MPSSAKSYQITISDDKTLLIDALHQNTLLSKQKLKLALLNGAVWLKNKIGVHRVRKAKKILAKDDVIFLYYNESILQQQPTKPTLIEDFDNFSIWHKLYGMYCQGSKWGDHCTINRWIEQNCQRPTFIVHRLDRATTGLIIIAHSKTIAQYFSKLFQAKQVEKHYHAKVLGQFPTKQQVVDFSINNKPALSILSLIEYNKKRNQSLINVEIKTGRKHQIRIHLSKLNYPIIGDRLYGDKNQEIDLQLCCHRLTFKNPNTGTNSTFINKKCD